MAIQVLGRAKLLAQQYDTYDHWRHYALTHAVNVDYYYGNQCWDICCLLWIQYNLYLETGNGFAYGCYALRREQNAKFPFSKVERKIDIKRGDCLVFWPSGLNYTGHICFADEDYNGTDIIKCLGQNQGQGTGMGKGSNVVNINLKRFCGGFRNANWKVTPPPVIVEHKPVKTRFPWVIYARKFRNSR